MEARSVLGQGLCTADCRRGAFLLRSPRWTILAGGSPVLVKSSPGTSHVAGTAVALKEGGRVPGLWPLPHVVWVLRAAPCRAEGSQESRWSSRWSLGFSAGLLLRPEPAWWLCGRALLGLVPPVIRVSMLTAAHSHPFPKPWVLGSSTPRGHVVTGSEGL